MANIPESWQNYPYNDPHRHWYDVLAEGNGIVDLRTLAQRWLQDLVDVGLQEVEPSSGTPPKEPASYYPRAEPLHAEIVPIKLDGSREVLWLKPNGRRSSQGFKRAEILDTFLSTDRAILAALTVLEAKEINLKELDEYLDTTENEFTNKEWPMPGEEEYEEVTQEIIQLAEEGVLDDMVEQSENDLREFRYITDDPKMQTAHTMSYVVVLLHRYRPDFSELAREEQVALVREGCRRVVKFLEALRHLAAFLEYWMPEKDLKSKVEDAARDIKAAELMDVEDISSVELGERLGVKPPQSDVKKRTNSTAGAMAKRGRILLQSTLGKGGWHKLVKDKRAQRDEYWARSEDE